MLRLIKHLKYASKALAKTPKNTWNHCKYMQHRDKSLTTYAWNICNIQISTLATYIKNGWNIGNKSVQHTCIIIATYATSRSTSATSIRSTSNIPMKHMKHLKHVFCNMGRPGPVQSAVRVGAGDERQHASTTSTSGGVSTTTTIAPGLARPSKQRAWRAKQAPPV
jgi:hypothetical protein